MTRSKFRKLSISLITVVLLCAVLFGASLPVVADTTQSVEKTDLFELLNIKYSKSELDAKTGTLISKQENFELKMGRFAEKTCITSKSSDKLKDAKEAVKDFNKALPALAEMIKDMKDGGDFDVAASLNATIDAMNAVLVILGPKAQLAGSIFSLVNTSFQLIMGGEKETSEILQLEDRLDQQFEELKNELADIEEQLNSLSNEINESTNRIIAEMPAALDRAQDKEDVRRFLLRYDGNFSYNEFRNYIYGDMTGNSNSSTAYYSYLKDALVSGGSDELVRGYYDALYTALITNMGYFEDYLAPDADNVKSIVKTYYDYLSANPDFSSKYGMTPEEAIVQFAYELYQTELMADSLILACNTYQYTRMLLDGTDKYDYDVGKGDFVSKAQIENMASAIEARQERISNQIAKDMVYVLGLNDFYLLEEMDGTIYAVSNDDAAFGHLVAGQTVYMNQMPESVCNIFGFDRYNYSYSLNSVANDGFFKATTINSDVVLSSLYCGEVAESIRFTVNSSSEFSGGSGTASNPYLVSSKEQFLRIGENLGAYYCLTRSIDMGGDTINPFGYSINSNGGESIKEFTGVLDGNGYTVSNFTVIGGTYAGLFCILNGAVENLTLFNVSVKSQPSSAEYSNSRFVIGTIAGENNGKIKNCAVVSTAGCGVEFSLDNNVTNRNITVCAGGLTGVNNGLVSACRVEGIFVKANSSHSFGGDSTKTNKNFVYAGGLVGMNNNLLGYSSVNDAVTVSAEATSTLSPQKNVDAYVEALSGGVCGKIGSNVSSDGMSSLYTAAKTDGVATIKYKGSHWPKGYDNRKQNITAEQAEQWSYIYNLTIPDEEHCYVPHVDEENIKKLECSKSEIDEFFGGINHDLDISVENIKAEYAANDDIFDTDDMTISVTDKQNSGTIYQVEKSSVLSVYGFIPYNASFNYVKEKKVAVILKLTLEDGNTLLAQKSMTVKFDKNKVVSVTVEQPDKAFFVNESDRETPLAELNGNNRVLYTYLVGADIGNFDATKLTGYTIKTECCVRCEECGSYNVSSSLVGSNVAYECQEDDCKHTGFVEYQSYDCLYRGKIGKYHATITGKYDGNDVSMSLEYVVNCMHLQDEAGYLVKDETVEPTCAALGYTQYHCKFCGEVLKKSYTAKSDVHKFVDDGQARPATCYAEGFTGRILCSVCGLVKDEGRVIPKLQHNYSEIVYEADGKTSYKHKCVNSEADGTFHYENHQYKVTESVLRDKTTGEYYIVYTYSCDCGYSKQEEDKNTQVYENTKLPTVMVSNGYAVRGSDVVTVYVQLLNNPGHGKSERDAGISAAAFGIRYDSRLVLKGFEDGPVMTGSLVKEYAAVNYGYNFVWGKGGDNSYSKMEGNLLKLEFIVPADAAEGDFYEISVVYGMDDGNPEKSGGFQEKSGKKCYVTRDGRITMVDRLPGDVNGDGVVDVQDAVLIGKYYVKEGSTMDVETRKSADVDLSGGVGLSDIVAILQSITGGYGQNLLYQKFQVILNGNGYDLDDGILNVSIYDEYNNTYSRAGLKDLERAGYKFDGWWTKLVGGEQIILADGSATGVQYFDYQKQQTLYAHWTLNSVTLNGNGNTNDVTEPKHSYEEGYTPGVIGNHFEQKYKVTFVDKSKNHQLSSEDRLLEYTLIGWALSAEDAEKRVIAYRADLSDLDLSEINLGELTLYAVWDEGTSAKKLFPEWDKRNVGYKDVRWYTNVELSTLLDTASANALIKAMAKRNGNAATVYANFEPIRYTIYFDANGGVGSKNPEDNHTVDQDASLNKNVSISRVGYRFAGWSLTPDGAATIGDGDRVAYIGTLQEDGSYSVKLYAVWVPYKYGINYNMNIPENALKVKNGSKEYSVGVITDQNLNKDMNPVYEMGKQYNLPANTYSIVGWNFVGWSLNPNGSGTIYGDYAPFKDLATCDGADETVTLYAVWEVDPYTVGKNVENGAKVSNTQGTKLYVVYNDITRTPQSVEAGYIHIVDWSSCTGTVDYIESVRRSDDGNGNIILDENGDIVWNTRVGGGNTNHDIRGNDEIYFIGNVNAVYKNLLLYTVGYDKDSELTIHFQDFNFESSNECIKSWYGDSNFDAGVRMTIEFRGNNSMRAGDGKCAIADFQNPINFVGDGTLAYKINFNANGGNSPEEYRAIMVYPEATSIGELPTMSKKGYNFVGWVYTDDSLNVNKDTVFSMRDSGTIRAKWNIITVFTINIDDCYISKNEGDSNHSRYFNVNTYDYFDVNYFINNGYQMRIRESYYAQYQNNKGYILNYLWISTGWVKRYCEKFEGNKQVDWSVDMSPNNYQFSIEYTSGNTWMWDCTSYNMVNHKVVIEYFIP